VIFKLPHDEAADADADADALDYPVAWARRGRISSFVKLQKSTVVHRPAMLSLEGHKPVLPGGA
jgi:hypothetical protein